MSMLPVKNVIVCGVGRTKQKVGMEHDINKIVAKFKRTGKIPTLNYDGESLSDSEKVVDLTSVGDYQECMNRIAMAQELFDKYPSMIKRRFNNSVKDYVKFMNNLNDTNNYNEAKMLGIIVEKTKPIINEVKNEVKTNG